jgi:hypothetical protein
VRKERERKAHGEDRKEQAQGEGGTAPQIEAGDDQAHRWCSPQTRGRTRIASKDCGAAQGRVKTIERGFRRPARGPARRPKFFFAWALSSAV